MQFVHAPIFVSESRTSRITASHSIASRCRIIHLGHDACEWIPVSALAAIAEAGCTTQSVIGKSLNAIGNSALNTERITLWRNAIVDRDALENVNPDQNTNALW